MWSKWRLFVFLTALSVWFMVWRTPLSSPLRLPIAPPEPGCPHGRFVAINADGRLGNKLCQYCTLWALQRESADARPAWILPEMQKALAPLFAGLELPTLPSACVQGHTSPALHSRSGPDFWKVSYFKYVSTGGGPPDRPLLLLDNPCDLSRFDRHRAALLPQLQFRQEVRDEAQSRLRRHTDVLCRGSPRCTYIGVHVRRTDYGRAVRNMFNGTLVGERYLARALALCRRRYRRPVFIVSSDDLDWVQQRLTDPDVVIAGSTGDGSAGRDMALLAQCNHTVVTHGTYGYMSAYLAQGDVIAPTGFAQRNAFTFEMMKERGLNTTAVLAF